MATNNSLRARCDDHGSHCTPCFTQNTLQKHRCSIASDTPLPYTQPDLRRTMRKRILALSGLLFLTACIGSQTLAMTAHFRTEDSGRKAQVIAALERVLERRVYAIEGTIPDTIIRGEGESARVTVPVDEKESKEILAAQLTAPLGFRLMIETAEGEEPDLTSEEFGSFSDTGITETVIDWVYAGEQESKGTISITFTPEGVTLLKPLFEKNAGKRLGLFVHGGLVSTYVIREGEDDKDNIVITGIPSSDLAQIFADDVNVGTYVTFTSIP